MGTILLMACIVAFGAVMAHGLIQRYRREATEKMRAERGRGQGRSRFVV